MRLDIKWYQYAVIDRFKFNACDHCEDGKVILSFVPQCTKLQWKKHTEQREEQRQIISSLNSGNRGFSDFRKIQIQGRPDHSGDREKQERQYAFFLYVHMAIGKSGSIGQDQNDHQDHDQVHAGRSCQMT